MESPDSLQTWKAIQGKMRNSGANSAYSAEEVLVHECVNHQRKEQPDTLGVAHELSLSHAPIDSSSTNMPSYSLRRSPSSEQLPSLQCNPPITMSRPFGMQSSHETTWSTTGGFKSFVNEVVGGAQPGSDHLAQGSPQQSDSSSPFDGTFFIRPKKTGRRTGRRWSMGSEPFVVPLSRGRIASDRPDAFYGDQHDQCYNSVVSLCVPSPHTVSEQSSLISILTDKWTRTTRGGNDANEKTDIENSSILRSRPQRAQRRLSEPFSSSASITDSFSQTRSNATPTIDSSQWALPTSEGHLLVDFPTTKRARGGPKNPPSKLLVDFPTTKKKQTPGQDKGKGGTKAVNQTGNKF